MPCEYQISVYHPCRLQFRIPAKIRSKKGQNICIILCMASTADFQKDIRQALNHLYNPEQLRKSPLVPWFGLSERPDAPSVLQHTLTDSIEALRPSQYEPVYSEARKTYEILLLRYIQQFSQPEVAHHIGVSERQFRREQDRAIDVLAEYVWKKYAAPGRQYVAFKHAEATKYVDAAKSISEKAEVTNAPSSLGGWNVDAEWGWIKKAYSERVTNTYAFISGIINLIQSVASQHRVVLQFNEVDKMPDLAVHPVALRQILLNVLRVAIAHAAGGQVRMDVIPGESLLELDVAGQRPIQSIAQPLFDQEENLLGIAAALMELSNGHMEYKEQPQGFRARLVLPLVEGVSILVVDDNRDIIELLRRYTTGTRYRVTGVDDPDQTFMAVERSGARMILLDVMMPKIDGWELLGRLRQHPLTHQIPVVIISILGQEDLALSLGARALLSKPFTQEKFLALMDQVYATLN